MCLRKALSWPAAREKRAGFCDFLRAHVQCILRQSNSYFSHGRAKTLGWFLERDDNFCGDALPGMLRVIPGGWRGLYAAQPDSRAADTANAFRIDTLSDVAVRIYHRCLVLACLILCAGYVLPVPQWQRN